MPLGQAANNTGVGGGFSAGIPTGGLPGGPTAGPGGTRPVGGQQQQPPFGGYLGWLAGMLPQFQNQQGGNSMPPYGYGGNQFGQPLNLYPGQQSQQGVREGYGMPPNQSNMSMPMGLLSNLTNLPGGAAPANRASMTQPPTRFGVL